MGYKLKFVDHQECYFCHEEIDNFGLVVTNDDQTPVIYAICKSCAIIQGVATDSEEWEDELRYLCQ